MAKFEPRCQDLPSSAAALARAPAWFTAPPQADAAARWDWLDDAQDCAVEVTEFAVTDDFIAALFGVSTHPGARAGARMAMAA